jgi:hypothetical protein
MLRRWLAVLLIALLPLHGIVHAAMGATAAAAPAATALAPQAGDGPCPMADGAGAAAVCATCDLCCAVVVAAPVALAAGPLPTAAPRIDAPGALPAEPDDRLYRPPR